MTAASTTLEGVLAGVRAGLGVALLSSAGGRPAGLVERTDLPPAGRTDFRMVVRRGLDPAVERAALAAGEDFFANRPVLQLVHA